jgi:F-type H+-transporting ATPase subunit epsilon
VSKVERLYLEIATPERLMVDQEVDMVEAPGTAGEFGILPGHVAFLTTLDHGEVRFMSEGRTRFVAISGGFAEVVDNKVTLLLDTAEFGEEIDLVRAQRAREKAEAALKSLTFEHGEYQTFQAALMRAITRISTASRSGQ